MEGLLGPEDRVGVGGMRRVPADDLYIGSIEFCWEFGVEGLPVGDPSKPP